VLLKAKSILDGFRENPYNSLAMSSPSNGEKLLSSWKEIAAYLGCDRRTCMRWERDSGLPVHRAGKLSRSHIFAYRSELDNWLRGRTNQEPSAKPRPWARPASWFRIPWVIFGPAIVLALAGYGLLQVFAGPGQPSDFRVEESRLIILDEHGRELWRFETGLKDLAHEAYYRNHFQRRRQVPHSSARAFPQLVIEDIDRDGNREVLFAPTGESSLGERLLCFGRKGRQLWTFDARREMTFGQKRLVPLFDISSVEFVPGNAPGQGRVVVVSNHYPLFPSYVAVLSVGGAPLGEFWNSGRLSDHIFLDLEGDGKTEMLLVGTNNEYRQGCLAVLDLDDVRGASPQTGEYRAAGLPPGAEMYYLLFPRTIVDKLEAEREIFTNIDAPAAGLILAVSEYTVLSYRLNSRLIVEDVTISDTYREKFTRYQSMGKIPPGRLDESAVRDELMKGVNYFDGEGWTAAPTLNRTWIDAEKR
jgi:hypothetical protein